MSSKITMKLSRAKKALNSLLCTSLSLNESDLETYVEYYIRHHTNYDYNNATRDFSVSFSIRGIDDTPLNFINRFMCEPHHNLKYILTRMILNKFEKDDIHNESNVLDDVIADSLSNLSSMDSTFRILSSACEDLSSYFTKIDDYVPTKFLTCFIDPVLEYNVRIRSDIHLTLKITDESFMILVFYKSEYFYVLDERLISDLEKMMNNTFVPNEFNNTGVL